MRNVAPIDQKCDRRRELFPTVPVQVEVLLHVYDYQGKGQCCCCASRRSGVLRVVGAVAMRALNFMLAHCFGLGLYHSGVEVDGREYCFSALPAYGPDRYGASRMRGGVTRVRPRDEADDLPHAYQTTISLGMALLSQQERDVILSFNHFHCV